METLGLVEDPQAPISGPKLTMARTMCSRTRLILGALSRGSRRRSPTTRHVLQGVG